MAATYGVTAQPSRAGLKENPKNLLSADFFNGFTIWGKLPVFFIFKTIFVF